MPSLVGVVFLALLASIVLTSSDAMGQVPSGHDSRWIEHATHVVVPQFRGYSVRGVPVTRGNPDLLLTRVTAYAEVQERTASTTLQLELKNNGRRPAEAVIVLPIPDGATVGGFDFQGQGHEPTAQLLPKTQARSIYRDIVARLRDPALLEFSGYRMLKTSVFPVPAGGTQTIRIHYDEILEGDGDRVDYVLPRSAALDNRVPWEITVDLHQNVAPSAIYSPTHALSKEVVRPGVVRAQALGHTTPGAFHFSFLLKDDALSASLYAYPDPEVGGGYFLLMASVPDKAPRQFEREVTLVIDRSGSMAGRKLEQAQRAAREVLDKLRPDEHFNVITYSNSVSMFTRGPSLVSTHREAAKQWISQMKPAGGTNISDALLEALRQPHTEGSVPLVLFLTDGIPTLGKKGELDIQHIARLANVHDRRIYTFGVGEDVNSPLLDRLAEMTRGMSTYVLPTDRIDTKVAKVLRRLNGPVLTHPKLITLDRNGEESTRLISEVLPHRLPDLYAGEQLVLLGHYHDDDPLTFQLRGRTAAGPHNYAFSFALDRASTKNAFVPRLWASRRIAYLSDAIRQSGAHASTTGPQKELVDEIVRLSTTFGVLTEYTAFLATEGTDLTNWSDVVANCSSNFSHRALDTRWGAGAVNQGYNIKFMKGQEVLNPRNGYVDANLQAVENARVRQMARGAFLYQSNQWVDSRSVLGGGILRVDEEVDFASPRYFQLLDRLERESRQGSMSLRGRTVIQIDGKNILLKQGKIDGC